MATEGKHLSHYDKAKVPSAEPFRFGLVVSEWNSHITEALLRGAKDALIDCGALEENIRVEYVPGSFELPSGAQAMLEYLKLDAVVAIGSVIRGETAHFDFVCQACAQGIKDVALRYSKPVIFCVLTDDNEGQSIARSGGKLGNKGVEAAIAAIQMAHFRGKFSHTKPAGFGR
jgi:6,7-dimethyl-8-ribityllumazine synthase